jgi:hypothetical protein
MHKDSVEADAPPGQVQPLGTWGAWGGRIGLEPTGPQTAILWFTPHEQDHDAGELFGEVAPDPESGRLIVAWNSAGRMTLGRSEVERIDPQIHHLMARWSR